jgi:ribosomal protein S18 acetylase RimI-like enzyme
MDSTLRPASEADHHFLFTLHARTMRHLIEQTWGWDEKWQRRDFARKLRRCRVSIIEVDQQSVGAIWIERHPRYVYITDLQVLPAFQGHGIGSAVLQEVIAETEGNKLSLRLSVLEINARAQRLYERCGFLVRRRSQPPFIEMVHGPSSGPKPPPHTGDT